MEMAQDSVAISAHLTVRDIQQSMAVYDSLFGFRRKMMIPGPGGKVMHGEMTYRGCTLMLGPESVAHGMRAPLSLGGTPVSLFLYVEDIDAVYARAQTIPEVRIISPINDQLFGCRTFVLHDPDGHQWMVAQQKQAMSAEEIEKAMAGNEHPPQHI